uniref:Uncharacterized protein n=1 Tax=Anguilla anguilla TaxID=7936 RepID=A0A0E9XTT1_ANGAN
MCNGKCLCSCLHQKHIFVDLHYMVTSFTFNISSKFMGINMGLIHPFLLEQPPLFWEGFY